MAPDGNSLSSSAWGRPVQVHRTPTNRWNPDVSTAATVEILRKLARQYASDASVQAANAEAFSRLGPGATERDLACAIFWWVRGHVVFVDDEELLYGVLGVQPPDLDKELLIVPPVLLNMPTPMGDCDDFSLLTASMLLSAGIEAYYVTVAADHMEPDKFSHIYVCAKLSDEGDHLCLDTGNKYPNIPPGWESSRVTRKAIWAI